MVYDKHWKAKYYYELAWEYIGLVTQAVIAIGKKVLPLLGEYIAMLAATVLSCIAIGALFALL